jgi:DNA primase
MTSNFKINVGELLTNLGIEYSSAGKNYRTLCWNSGHNDTNASLFIDKETGVFFCFGCGMKGGVFNVINHKAGVSGLEAYEYIGNYIKGGQTEEEQYEDLKNFVSSRNKEEVLERIIVDIPENEKIDSHPYLVKRGFRKEEIIRWQVGVVTDKRKKFYPYKNWLIIPIYQDGILKTYFLRNPNGDQKMYGPYPRLDVIAGLDLISDYKKPVYLLEGIFKTWPMQRIGKQAIAALSNRLLEKQIEVLKKKGIKKLIIVPDNPKNSEDVSGEEIIKTALPLMHNLELHVCTMPLEKKDTDLCTIDELLWATTYSEVPIFEYIQNKVFNKEWI